MKHHINYTMLCDFYELTMGNGYLRTGMGERICYFDLFFRSVPDGGGFAIAAGLERVVEYIMDAVSDFDMVNAKLAAVLSRLSEEDVF